ncbi:retrovirus-related pol polyprotein from transposon TNT 1-94 [Tanacetum coccineum]
MNVQDSSLTPENEEVINLQGRNNFIAAFHPDSMLSRLANVTAIEEAKVLKLTYTRRKTSVDRISQRGKCEDIDEEEEAEAFNLIASNFSKFFCKSNQFGRRNRFGNRRNRFGKDCESHFVGECRKPKENKAFIRGAWSDSEDDDEHQNDTTCIMAIDSQEIVSKPSSSNHDLKIIDLQKENEKLLEFNKDFTKKLKKLLNEKRSLENENSILLSKVNDLEFEVKKLAHKTIGFVSRSSCTNHIDRGKEDIRFTSYKAYDGGHVVFGSNLKGKVVGEGSQGNANNRTRKEVSTTRVLELLHLDLFGPSPIQSYEGNFYTLMIVDDYLNYTWVVFVESKEDVLEKFKILCKRLENLHDCSIASIVINHSSEFDKLQSGSFYEQRGMSYNLSGPFTSQLNEIVERTHRKLRKMSRAMLDSKSNPYTQKFW